MKHPKPRQRFFLLAMFCAAAFLLITLCPLGLAHANQEQVAKASKGSPCAGGSRSGEPGVKGVVCNHWQTLIEDSFEGGFTNPPWHADTYPPDPPFLDSDWELTNCTASHGENSIWCEESEIPCSGPYYSYGVYSIAAHDRLDIPNNCDILKVSFDYKYTEAEDMGKDAWEYLMVDLQWKNPDWDPEVDPPWEEWAEW